MPDYRPGTRERHLLRKRDNPLFGAAAAVSEADIATARRLDHLDQERFMARFRDLVQRAVDLEPNTPSETVLEIKEQLDLSYQQVCALPGDHAEIKQAIARLVNVIMQSVEAGIGNDAFARQQLRDEQIARQAHFELQDVPLVADLTHPESPVAEDELIPTLLSEPVETLGPALRLFDESQLATLWRDATGFLEQLDPDKTVADAWRRLALIEQSYRAMQPQSRPN
jgi:hypothetical protein